MLVTTCPLKNEGSDFGQKIAVVLKENPPVQNKLANGKFISSMLTIFFVCASD